MLCFQNLPLGSETGPGGLDRLVGYGCCGDSAAQGARKEVRENRIVIAKKRRLAKQTATSLSAQGPDLDGLSLRFFLRLTQKIHSHLCNPVAITPDVDGKDTIAAKPAHDYTKPSMTLTIVKLGYAPMLLASKQSKEGLPILGRMFVSIGSGEVARIADDDHASVNANSASVFPTHVFGC